MILQEILRAVTALNDEERQLLRQHIDRPRKGISAAPKERTRRLNAALDAMA